MGVDIYMHWKDQSEEEEKAQYTGFSLDAGAKGYIREAYHGNPMVTMEMFKECFGGNEENTEDKGVEFTSGKLLSRLPAAIESVLAKQKTRYVANPMYSLYMTRSLCDFVELAIEKEKLTGSSVRIYASY
jgi:hypothetical protein